MDFLGGKKVNAEQLRKRIEGYPDDYVFHLTVPTPVVEQHWATTLVTVAQAKAFADCMEEAHFLEFGDVVQIHEDEWFALLKAFGLKQ